MADQGVAQRGRAEAAARPRRLVHGHAAAGRGGGEVWHQEAGGGGAAAGEEVSRLAVQAVGCPVRVWDAELDERADGWGEGAVL